MVRRPLVVLVGPVLCLALVVACGPPTPSEQVEAPPPSPQPGETVADVAPTKTIEPSATAAVAPPPTAETVPEPSPETPSEPPTEEPPPAALVEPLAEVCDLSQAAWIGTFGFGLNCLDGAGWHLHTEDDTAISNQTADLAVCPNGMVWILHSYGASATDGGSWNTFRDAWGYGSPEAVACDGAGGVWVAHYEGVSHYDGGQWTTHEASKLGTGENVKLVKDVAVAPSGMVWVVTANSVAAYDAGTWTIYETGKGFDKDYYFEQVVVDGKGQVWAGHSGGVWQFDGTNWVAHEGRHLGQVKSLLVGADDRLWAGTVANGVSVYDGKSWVTYDRENSGLSSNQVRALATDDQGRIWLGTEWGLDVFDGGGWQSYQMGNSDLADNDVYALAVAGNGPPLLVPVEEPAGSLAGTIVRGSDSVAGASVEACAEFIGMVFSGPSPCADMAFHAAAVTGDDGTFRFAELPEGRYGLALQAGDEGWGRLTGRFGIGDKKVTVLAGQETDLGEIDISQ
jgi:hypothetical protein